MKRKTISTFIILPQEQQGKRQAFTKEQKTELHKKTQEEGRKDFGGKFAVLSARISKKRRPAKTRPS